MGPAVLITLGVLFLFDQMDVVCWMHFHYTWPAILIVVGIVKLLDHSASMEGHIPPGWQGQVPGYGAPPYVAPPVPPQPPVAPPPMPPAGFITPGSKGPDQRGGA